MIQVTPQMRVLVAIEPADLRRGIDVLARRVRADLSGDPFCGTVLVLRNRRAMAVKVLPHDRRGFWVFRDTWARAQGGLLQRMLYVDCEHLARGQPARARRPNGAGGVR